MVEWPTDANVLVIRNFINSNEVDGLFNEVLAYDWDSKYLCTRRKKVLDGFVIRISFKSIFSSV